MINETAAAALREELAKLTEEGRKWAEENAPTSMVAKVALGGAEGGWPEAHVQAAIKACNDGASTEKWRVDVQGVGESIWTSNALRFDTEAEAEAYARDLYARWMGMQAWRVVPESTPEREAVES